ncbi:hypothetical protein L1F30_12295 [Simiduia sp. 21SJ11W-1]|uniref:hypothetical protein n=1 Tax=Simiduia sp. 21SJ11W-1 TaxID=2909669 RepID=UPI00209D1A01|nr:hypothetical protein [Simiduia sp. 21SJ11W-1]UTA46941.1 hypothetical protein L1F30_12295 [Simiduia sp. 21SJ11W-1]
MDPVSMLFGAYLNAVQSTVHNHLTDAMGTELKSINIEYQGTGIPFQYQMWRIREQSVCAGFDANIGKKSECTQKAKALFAELCSYLTANPKPHWRHSKTKNMYCNAAVSYKPVIADLGPAAEKSNLAKAKAQCSAATVAAMGSTEARLIRERDAVCGVYRGMLK